MFKSLKKISRKELIWYSASVAIAIVGLVFLILGIVADNLSVNSSLRKAQGNFPWRYIGLIIIACAVILSIIVLLVNAHKVDRVVDREQRRKLRLQAMLSDTNEDTDTLTVNEQGKIESAKKVETISSNEENNYSKTTNISSDKSLDNAVISDDLKGKNNNNENI